MLVIVLIAWQAADAARMPLNVYIPSSIAASATPEIHLQPTLGTRIASFFRREKPIVTKISLTDAAGKQISVPFGRQTATLTNATTIVIPKTENFHPGKYQASVTTRQGNTERTVTQDFDWGILALNVPSATVQPWEDVPLHMAVLDDKGDMVCAAAVTITVTDPNGKRTLYQTGERRLPVRPIGVNPECARKERTERPDYEAHYRPVVSGMYSVHVIADTKNGRRELNDTFLVDTVSVFSIRRTTFPTRIYPAASYPVEFVIRPSQTYIGTFTESVPASFVLSGITNNGTVRLANAERQIITWNVDWQAGQTYRLGYTFDAPDTSPAFYQLGPYSTSSTIEARQWQIAVDATKTWDGGGGDGLWSTAANWNNDTLPVAGDDIVFDGTSGSANATWDSAFAVDTIGSLTDTRTAGTIIFTKTPVTVTNAFSSTGTGGAITFTGSASVTVGGNFTLTSTGAFTANTSTLTLTGTSNNFNSGKSFNNLTIDPSTTGTVTVSTNDPSVNGTLTIAASDTLSIGSFRNVKVNYGGTVTINSTGTISGSGTLYLYDATLGTVGTLNSQVTFDLTSGDYSIPARTYGGAVTITTGFPGGGTTATLGTATGQTLTFSGNLTLDDTATLGLTIAGNTYNPTVNITGNFTANTIDSAGYVVNTGTGTWTVGGNFNLTNMGSFTHGGTLVMNGASKTLTSNGKTLNNVTLSGTITLANATHTVAGSLDMTGGTITAGTSTVKMTGTGGKTITGGGVTIANLTIDPTSADTITLQTTDLTVSSTVSIAASDTLSIALGRTLTHTGATLTLTGTITGAGTYVYSSSTAFPTAGTISSALRFDSTNNAQTVSARTFGGAVEFYNNSASTARTITLGTFMLQLVTFSSNVTLNAANGGNITLSGATNNPTINITGDIDYTGIGAGTESITTGNLQWTVAGNVDFTDGTLTATTNNVFKMTGSKNLIGAGQTFYRLLIDGSGITVTVTTSDFTVSNLLTVGVALDNNDDTLSIASGRTVTSGTGSTVTLTGSGTDSITGAGTLIVQNSNLGTLGTLSSGVRFDATSGDISIPQRTYGGAVEAYSNSGSAARVVTAGTAASQTLTFQSTLTVTANNSQNVTLAGATQNPAVSITGSISCSKPSSGQPTITTGTGTWTASASIDFTNCSVTAANTFAVNGTTSQTVTSGGQSFNSLTLNNTGSAGTSNDDVIPSDTLTISGNLTVTQGEFKLSTNNPNVSIAGNVSIASAGIVTKGTGTWTFNGTTAATYTDLTATPQNLGIVSINKTNSSSPSTNDKLTLASSATLDTLTIDGTSGQADTLDLGSSGYTLTLANAGATATVLTNNGTLTVGTSTIAYTATNSSGNITVYPTAYSSLTVSGAETYVVSGDVTVTGALTTGSSGTISINSGKTLTHTGSSMTNSGTISGSGTLLFTDTSSGPGTSGTISSAVRYDASSGDINSGTVDARTYDGPVVFYANSASTHMIILASGTYTLSGSSADFTMTNDGSGTLTVDATTNPDVTVGGSFSFVGAGTETLKSGTGTWTFSGNVNLGNGIFTATSGNTLAMDGSGKTLTTAGQTLYNLTISGGSIAASGTTTVANTLTISAGALTAPSGTLNVGGNFSNSATFTANGGTVVLTAASGTKTITNSGTGSFSGLTLSGGATWQMGSVLTVSDLTISSGTLNQGNKNLTINSSLTISGGTFSGGTGALDINGTLTLALGTMTAPSGDTTLSGDFLHTGGTFTHNTGTIVLDGSNQTISGTTTFYNLTKVISTTARTLTFPVGATQTIVGSLTLKGADGAALSLRSSSAGTQWTIDPQGARSIQYLDVQDSDNAGAAISTVGLFITDSGNNTGWQFPPHAPSNLSGTALSSTSVQWTWKENSSDEDGFKFESSDGIVVATLDPNTATYTETGLVKGTTYSRKVLAYNSQGESAATDVIQATTNASPPTAPVLTSLDNNALMNTLTPAFSFDRSTDADDGMGTYTLFLNPGLDTAKTVFLGDVPTSGTQNQEFASVTGTADTGTAQLTDDTLLNEGSNTWQIRATDTAENSSDSVVRTLVIDVTKPTLTAFSLTPQATGSKTSAYLSTSQRPTLTLTAQDSYQLQKVVVHFLRRRFLLGEEIGTTEELTRTVLVSGTQQTVAVTPVSPLPYGVYTLRMETFDAAGNSSMTERSVTLQTAEKITQRPTTPGATPSQEREKQIEQGTTPTKVPVDLTLPSLEKHAFERREKEAANLTGFLQHFIPQSRLDRFELSMNHTVTQARALVSTLARSTGRHLAAFFGFSTDALAQLRLLMQLPACGSDCATQEQLVRATPLGATLNNIFPKATGRFLVTWKTFQNRATRLLIAGRKNRSHVAGRSEASIARALQPVAHTVQWIGIGVRVALEGMRGKYDQRLQITNVAIKSLVPDSTTVSWTTNRVSKGKINYGQTISYGQEALEQSFVLNHTIELKGLQPATKYYFEVLETDVGGEQTFDAYYGFTTPVL